MVTVKVVARVGFMAKTLNEKSFPTEEAEAIFNDLTDKLDWIAGFMGGK